MRKPDTFKGNIALYRLALIALAVGRAGDDVDAVISGARLRATRAALGRSGNLSCDQHAFGMTRRSLGALSLDRRAPSGVRDDTERLFPFKP